MPLPDRPPYRRVPVGRDSLRRGTHWLGLRGLGETVLSETAGRRRGRVGDRWRPIGQARMSQEQSGRISKRSPSDRNDADQRSRRPEAWQPRSPLISGAAAHSRSYKRKHAHRRTPARFATGVVGAVSRCHSAMRATRAARSRSRCPNWRLASLPWCLAPPHLSAETNLGGAQAHDGLPCWRTPSPRRSRSVPSSGGAAWPGWIVGPGVSPH